MKINVAQELTSIVFAYLLRVHSISLSLSCVVDFQAPYYYYYYQHLELASSQVVCGLTLDNARAQKSRVCN